MSEVFSKKELVDLFNDAVDKTLDPKGSYGTRLTGTIKQCAQGSASDKGKTFYLNGQLIDNRFFSAKTGSVQTKLSRSSSLSLETDNGQLVSLEYLYSQEPRADTLVSNEDLNDDESQDKNTLLRATWQSPGGDLNLNTVLSKARKVNKRSAQVMKDKFKAFVEEVYHFSKLDKKRNKK